MPTTLRAPLKAETHSQYLEDKRKGRHPQIFNKVTQIIPMKARRIYSMFALLEDTHLLSPCAQLEQRD